LNQRCNVVAAARSSEPLEKLRSDYPEQVQLLVGDLADFSLSQKAVDLAKSKWGRLDGLIINHGVLNPVTRIRDVEIEEWRECFNVNVFSAVAMVYHFNAIRYLRANDDDR
jgi:NADP-dependent 3-hydroxy acid dehydrogenase YdfG